MAQRKRPPLKGGTTQAPPKATPRPPVPVALVRPSVTWEYCLRQLGTTPERQAAQLAELGAVGWELVTVTASDSLQGGLATAYFKRRAESGYGA
jgi:hypothetical protein